MPPTDSLELHFVSNDYEKHFSVSAQWKYLKHFTIADAKKRMVDLVRFISEVPVDENYVKFWKLKSPLTLPSFSHESITYPKGPLSEKAIPVDIESTQIREFFDGANPLYMESVLHLKVREATPFEVHSLLWKKITEIYSMLEDTQAPFCSGTYPIPIDKCVVQYRSSDGLREINLSNATENELDHLTRACKPASFGRGDQDVLDETYRKAGKMDGGDYLTNFSIEDTSIIDVLKSSLVQFGNRFDREVQFELYKLNVYGKGSFFKRHKDTPRSDGMFGSLVIVFPTAHEGGVLTLYHHDREWDVDLSMMISQAQETPSVGFVAFYSDVDHEVKEVTSGHRVTLTYNLFFAPSTQPTPRSLDIKEIQPFGEKSINLMNAIKDVSGFYPLQKYGGYLAFGLLYQYPASEQGSVAALRHSLKGQDAAIASILDKLGLEWKIRICYQSHVQHHRTTYFLSKFVAQFESYAYIPQFDYLFPEAEYVTFVLDSPFKNIVAQSSMDSDSEYESYSWTGRPLIPLTPIPRFPHRPSKFIEYGNETLPGKLYADVCLVIEVAAKIPGTELKKKMACAADGDKRDLPVPPDDLEDESE